MAGKLPPEVEELLYRFGQGEIELDEFQESINDYNSKVIRKYNERAHRKFKFICQMQGGIMVASDIQNGYVICFDRSIFSGNN